MDLANVGGGSALASLDLSGAAPVLSDEAFAQRQAQLRTALVALGAEPLALPPA